MIRRLFRWLADVPPSVSAFGRRLDALRETVEEELDAMRQREENRRGQLLTLGRMVSALKARVATIEDYLEGVDSDELDDGSDEWVRLRQPDEALDELAHKRLTPRKEA